MAHVEIHKATVADAEVMAPRMREADALEVYRAAGFAPMEALIRSMMESDGRAHALYFDGEPAAMFGLVRPEVLGPLGIPWLLTTDAFGKHPVTAFRIAKAMISEWSKECPVLLQMVDEEYVSARHFLKRLGFTIHPPVPHGVARAPFCPAVRSSHV